MKNFFAFIFLLGNIVCSQAIAQSGGEQCFISPTNPTNVFAKTTWTYNGTNQTYTFRTTFAKTFVDNTYGTNIIGWPKDHKFGDLVGSDHLQMALYDAANNKKLEFKLDYITSSNTVSSGYKSLGVTGGDGKMLTGSASDITGAKTSLDANFNDFGYVLTTNSPATTATYSPNATYPNWIFDVWYEVTVKASAFGTSGFGKPVITGIHASPSKTGNNSEDVNPGPCPGEVRLGNQIWEDLNNDGIKQSTENGIVGLTVRLYVDANADNIPDGAAITTTTTGANGTYLFSGLADGKYIIGVVKPFAFEIGTTTATSANPNNDIDNDNNGIVSTSGEIRTNYITLAKGTEPTNDGDDNNGNLTLDIGLKKSATSGTGGEICFVSPTNPTNVYAKTNWTYNSSNQSYTFRTTFAKTFVDNTYGTNSIGWGSKGHTFSNLVGSDHLQMAFYDGTDSKKIEVKLDYITSDNTAPGGYKSLGVTGGDGKMILGTASDVIGAKSSLDANFNDFGYVLTSNSPATDANYTANATYPNWIYDVWYEVTVKASAFGVSGFGRPEITGVHASPSKTGNNSEVVVPGPCPGEMKLGNLIWHDANDDGIKQASELGIAGLTVKLYADANGDNIPDGAAISSTTTDANGFYYFSSLQEGKYIVGVTKANGYGKAGTTANSANPNSDIDNDNNGVNDINNEIRTNFITLIKGTEPTNDGDDNNGNLTLDIGLFKVNQPPTGGEICFASPTNAACVNARIQYTINNNNGTVTLRTIFSKCFVDNTYGTNSIGWTSKGHSFGNLVGSDKLQLALFDANNVKKLDFTLDYISSTSTVPSGYRSLGVTGGDGRMNLGDASDIISAKSSLDANFNDFGYVLTTNSPATDANYTPNPAYPNWIYDVWYETTIKLSAFGSAGFGTAEIASVHASPSKTGNNTEVVVPVPCPSMLKLGNLVFRDLNNNGVKDASEPGVGGLTVKLYQDNNGDNIPDGAAVGTTTTDANGNYLFSNLAAGNYIVGVTIPAGNEPAITTATSANPNNDIDNDNNGVRTVTGELRSNFITLSVLGEPINDGDDSNGNLTMDFGIKAIVSTGMNLGNLVWNDLNVNGIKDASEPGMPNVRVRLYRDVDGDNTPDGPAIDSMLTNASGNYNFTNLAEGKYIVGIVLPTNYMATIGIPSSFNPDNDVDNDNNGIVTINNKEVQSRFITLLANTEPTNDGDGANGNLTLDFGLFVCGNLLIGDYVWNDTNGNGLQGDDEYGIADVKVTLVSADGTTRITYTDANGYYYFTNLNAGTYKVQFETPAGYRPTISNNGPSDKDSDPINGEVTVILSSVQPGNLTIDAGFILVKLNLGNLVFNDVNKNGVKDAGEPGIGGLRVNLYRDDNADNTPDGLRIATIVTDANGNYNFGNLDAGKYIVGVEIDPNAYSNGPVPPTGINPDNNVDNDNNGVITLGSEIFSLNITLSPGDEPINDGDGSDGNLTLDFGLVPAPKPPFNLTLGNTVWYDENGDGIFDLNEVGIGDLKVWLYEDANGDNIPDGPAIDSTITSNFDGSYGFNNVDDGKYIVGVQLPAGYLLGNVIGTSSNPDNDLDNDNNGIRVVNGEVRSNFITLISGTEPTNDGDDNNGNLTLDFGFVTSVSGSIGDRVWNDINKNGIQDAGEVGLAGVVVTLYQGATNTVIASTITDAFGNYQFGNLPTSVGGTPYQVRFSQVPGYTFSPNNGAITDPNNSDANVVTGRTGTITLTNAAPSASYVDAGLYFTESARLGDFVWNDLNKNGIQEANEPGIAGVTVMLYTSANVLYRSTVTANTGLYYFNDVAPGTYYVKVALPIGYVASPKDQGGNDNIDSDIDPVTLQTDNIVVVAGTNNLTIDAGLHVASTTGAFASLGDKVWEDLNNNNLQDAGEPGIANVTVELYNSSNVLVATTTTDAFGNYIFNGIVPGNYYVKFTTPAGFGLVTPNVGTNDDIDSDVDGTNGAGTTATITLIGGQVNTSVDAGYRRTASGTTSIGDFVWYDLNKNGIQDGGSEVGVPGVTVLLYNSANTVVQTRTTDEFGFYLFTGLPASTTYTVGFLNIPAGYDFSPQIGAITLPTNSDVNPTTGRTAAVTTGAAGSIITYVDAGLIISPNTFPSKSTIGDRVWNDLNNNGIQDAGEPGIAGVIVTLYAADGVTVVTTTTTDALGNYLFTNIDAGSYVVGFSNLPAGYVFATKDAGSDDTKDSDANPSTGKTDPFTLGAGEINLTIDAGLRNSTTGLSTIGNFVWYDVNGNGIQNAGEPGAEGISVTLKDALGNVVKTTTTAADGSYLFTDLTAGTYFVQFGNLPAGYTATAKNAPGSTPANNSDADPVTLTTDAINLPASTNDLDWDFGIVTTSRALIGDFVWNDTNGNGVQDPGEPGVAGVTVTLYDAANNAIAQTVTDANGNYFFANLLPGTYKVGFSNIPSLSSFTTKNAPGSNADNNSDVDAAGFTDAFTLVAGQSKTDIDAGLVSLMASVGDYVWNDLNRNGIQDAGEVGVPGITVTLHTAGPDGIIGNGDDMAIASSVTDAKGFYLINNIPVSSAGSQFYMRYTDLPLSSTFTLPLVGGAGASNNSKVTLQDPTNGRTGFFTLNPGQIYLAMDAGIYQANGSIGDYVWQDYNKNGIQDAGEPPFPGVIVRLTKPGGDVISTTTNASGNYSFSNLPAGSYTVCFVTPVPTAFFRSPAGMGTDRTKDSDPVNGCVTVVLAAGENKTDIDAGFYDDIDDDDDGIPDLVEGHGYDGLMDCDGDGIPNYMDPTPGCPTPPGLDTYGNPFKPLVWSDCPRPGFPTGDGINDFFDHDNDGVIDQLDLDSDNDGILDAYETRDPRMVDANRDGLVDGPDSDGDGLMDSADQTPFAYGGPGLIPQDLDRDGIPNYLDLDSDGDGISDLTEAREFFDNDGLADGIDTDGDGVNDVYDQIVGHGARGVDLMDRDNDGYPNPYDIDSDNDGITDNVEAQPTCSEKQPSGIDADGDGMDDIYDSNISACIRKAPGITPFDKDGDGIPDIYDLDTDNDGAPDVNEGSGISGNFVTNFNDTDKDGLIDQFDIFNILTATEKFFNNVVHSQMGPNGNFDGPTPAGSNANVAGDACDPGNANKDRAWRSVAVLPVSILEFRGNLNNNHVKLNWVVTNESNISHYNVERSVDGRNYAVVAKVNANNITGVSNYASIDDVSALSNVTVYYRLQQVEKSGELKFSHVVNFKLNGSSVMDMVVYPNPASQYFTLKVKTEKEVKASFRVMDMTGRTIVMRNINLSAGTNAINFDDLGKFASGTYTIQAIINGEMYHQKLMINR